MHSRSAWIAVASGLALFFLMWMLVSRSPMPALEQDLLLRIAAVRTEALNTVAVWITNTGSLNILVPLSLLVSGLLLWKRRWVHSGLFLATLLWYPLLLPIRVFIDRQPPRYDLRSPTQGVVYLAEAPLERAGQQLAAATAAPPAAAAPAAPQPEPPWYAPAIGFLYRGLLRGFPSNHAAASGYFYGLCLLWARHRGFRVLGLACALLIPVIGISRVYMGVHYPSDVLASWGLVLAALGAARSAFQPDPSLRTVAKSDAVSY
jgi:membrane-associated phospholipid phosphatase